jgi:hypothetical protein
LGAARAAYSGARLRRVALCAGGRAGGVHRLRRVASGLDRIQEKSI